MAVDDGIVLPLLRRERDHVAYEIDANVKAIIDYPSYTVPWLDRNAMIADMRLEYAALNAAIARRLGISLSTGTHAVPDHKRA